MKRTTLVAISALAVLASASLIAAARGAKMRTLADTTVRSVVSTEHDGALLRAITVTRKPGKHVMYLEQVKPGSPGVVERQQLVKARYGRYDQLQWKAATLHFRMTVGERFRGCRVKLSPTRAKPVARCDRKWQKPAKASALK